MPGYAHAREHMSKYELGEELGRGGMGVVHRARQLGLDREVALKLLLPVAEGGEGDAARFMREVETLAKLAHPHIIRVLDSGQDFPAGLRVIEEVDRPRFLGDA